GHCGNALTRQLIEHEQGHMRPDHHRGWLPTADRQRRQCLLLPVSFRRYAGLTETDESNYGLHPNVAGDVVQSLDQGREGTTVKALVHRVLPGNYAERCSRGTAHFP